MRLVATKSIKEGSELAKPIYNDKGKALIQKNVNLTDGMIRRLQDMGITYVYIKDEVTEDILVPSPISDELRIEAIQTVKQSFATYQHNGFGKKVYLIDKTNESMAKVVDSMIHQLKDDQEVLTVMSHILISDDYVFSHSVNVTMYALALATELKLSAKQIRQLGLGAMLHDVGKMFISEEILNKTGKLNDQEFEMVKKHTEKGFDYLRQSTNFPLLVAHCAYQHHERLDGSGYPRGITHKDIHPFGKILAVADVFDAVTSNRVYRDAMLPHEGLELLYAGSGSLFDPELVRTFKNTIAVFPNGSTICLSDNRIAIVVKQNHQLYERPIVRVIKEQGESVTPYDLDLAKELDLTVVDYAL
ncbi:Cyclic di-GMP phosphodiesterase response regulator RpfG [Paraliobacillus sp. PM-2]|uniref:HD-GYP domain-containing protein n=1 Tax=Paraliobacillus sp. PM-2 TaxID=1462524 RepID=UPI00061C39A0|nr:HD-GYP domain-containing protein [Paraliobacillus sp. PM-2]CQR46550.1 Cyclic di-GMP phosphodiesterase response regulator RpfG [Paraliobacillus sp. PM-2]